jgi:hypothetical protein
VNIVRYTGKELRMGVYVRVVLNNLLNLCPSVQKRKYRMI